jgi:hypothetical protein
MARNALEAILQARFEWQTCPEEQRDDKRRAYESLIDQAISAFPSGPSREELEEALREPYREFKRAKLLEERAKLSRLR